MNKHNFGLTILFFIFLIFKLAAIGVVADWSWWWVTSPIWIPLSLVIIVGILFGLKLTFIYFRNRNKK